MAGEDQTLLYLTSWTSKQLNGVADGGRAIYRLAVAASWKICSRRFGSTPGVWEKFM
jgi:hypothetical protein